MSNATKNILMAGVGGQGVILASEIVSEAVMLAGFDVKKSEVHGMAQRGGSVTSHVRFGEKVYSPIIRDGSVDILFSFELLETSLGAPARLRSGTQHQRLTAQTVAQANHDAVGHCQRAGSGVQVRGLRC